VIIRSNTARTWLGYCSIDVDPLAVVIEVVQPVCGGRALGGLAADRFIGEVDLVGCPTGQVRHNCHGLSLAWTVVEEGADLRATHAGKRCQADPSVASEASREESHPAVL
jgi:hypothetical protein